MKFLSLRFRTITYDYSICHMLCKMYHQFFHQHRISSEILSVLSCFPPVDIKINLIISRISFRWEEGAGGVLTLPPPPLRVATIHIRNTCTSKNLNDESVQSGRFAHLKSINFTLRAVGDTSHILATFDLKWRATSGYY